jgi:hypothetical protein
MLAVTSVLALGTTIAACGSRGPLDIEIIEAPSDGGRDVVLVDADANAADAQDASHDVADARPEASFVDCSACLAQRCGGPILVCLQNMACRTTFQCAVQNCATGGSPDPACFFQCGQSDPQGLSAALGVFTCVTGKCGPDCTSVLGGLLGGGGGRDAG